MTPRFVAGLKMLIKVRPRRAMSDLAKGCQVSISTWSRVIKEDLNMFIYCLYKSQSPTVTRRVDKGAHLLNDPKSKKRRLIFSSGEKKNWTMDLTHIQKIR